MNTFESAKQNCPICNSSDSKLLTTAKDYFVGNGNLTEFNVEACQSCLLIFTSPILSSTELSQYYPPQYEAYVKRSALHSILQKIKYRLDINFIKSLFAKGSQNISIFEFGAGRGEFLSNLRDAGFKCHGIEPSENGVNSASKMFDVKLDQAYADDYIFTRRYDLVTGRHVFEHLLNPKLFLESIASTGLNENGFLIIKIPNIDSWEYRLFGKYWHGLDLPRHRFHFSENTVSKIMAESGFKSVECRYELVPTDITRSIANFARYSDPSLIQKVALIFSNLPFFIQVMPVSFAAFILQHWKPGRMVIVGRV